MLVVVLGNHIRNQQNEPKELFHLIVPYVFTPLSPRLHGDLGKSNCLQPPSVKEYPKAEYTQP